MRKLIQVELNEVPFFVLDQYVRKYPGSAVSKVLELSSQYETITPDQGHLHPWSTWPTFHRGVSNEVHRIKDLGEELEERDKKYPPVWKILADNGFRSGLFSSLHTFPLPSDLSKYDFVIPDPFAESSDVYPKGIQSFQEFNLRMSRRSGRNVDSGIDMRSAFKLLLDLPFLGIRIPTASRVLAQLAAEAGQPWKKSRRRILQSVLAFDVFFKLLRKHRPDFVTFFSNHVASTMHRYWAAAFPETIQGNDFDKQWLARYQGEVDVAMNVFNDFLKRLARFVDNHPEYILMVASSMGQEAVASRQVESELFLENLPRLMEYFEIPDDEWEEKPAMHPQYNVLLDDERVDYFRRSLEKVRIQDRPLEFRQKDGQFFSIDFGHINVTGEDVTVDDVPVNLSQLGIGNKKVDEGRSGTAYHVPEGMLFVYDPVSGPAGSRQSGISTLAMAPTILENFGIPVPDYMTDQRIPAIR